MENKRFNNNWLAALLLCFFLGCIGAHHFFAGNKKKAITMLLITLLTGWFGVGLVITGIWSLYDFIMIICQKFTDGEGNIITFEV